MATKKDYRANNFYLNDIIDIAKFLHERKLSEDKLFEAINKLSEVFVLENRDKYLGDHGPVNSLRGQLAQLMLEKKLLSKELVDDRISVIEKGSGKRSFKSYTPFAIFYPFFHSGIEFDVKESLTSLSDTIVNSLDLAGRVKIHSVDFWGSRGFGEDQVWTAIYNTSHKSQQTAKQLFIRVNHDGVWCGLYDRANMRFADDMFFQEFKENIVENIINYFEQYKNEILNDEYSKAKYLSVGVNGSKFFKISHGIEFFTKDEIQECIDSDIVVVHKDTKAKARTLISQYKNFKEANAGDLFYCCWGNNQFLFIGQFIDKDVRDYSLSIDPEGWKERSYRIIQQVQVTESFKGPKKWWAPNDPSTFIEVPTSEYEELNKLILRPYFHAELDEKKMTMLPQEKIGVSSQKRIKVLDQKISPKLDVKMVAREFANIIDNLDDNKGQMLGVFGSWGRGKTFFVDQLLKEFLPDEGQNQRYINLTFNAWKYQETEAIWAYLYEVVLNSYLSDKIDKSSKEWRKKHIKWWKTFNLNLKRKGYVRLIGIVLSFAASIIMTYVITSEFKRGAIFWAISAVGIIGVIQGYRIYKKYYQGFKDVIKYYSAQHNYKAVLGVQAEIQDELITLLKHWLGKYDERRVLLFVDDLDRCNEDKIIRIIDALRVMLDDDYLVSKLIIIVAVDELLLERAIQLKYKDFEISKSEKNIVQEYMDKLFIGGIKFPGLYADEQAVILETYALDGKILEQFAQKEFDNAGPIALIIDEEGKEFNYPEPDINNLKTIEGEFFLLKTELSNLQKYAKELGNNITPRALRIYMYRYLLSKNLAGAYMSSNSRYQLDEEFCDFMARCIALKSNDSKKNVVEVEGYDLIENKKLKDFVPKLIEMVVPY